MLLLLLMLLETNAVVDRAHTANRFNMVAGCQKKCSLLDGKIQKRESIKETKTWFLYRQATNLVRGEERNPRILDILQRKQHAKKARKWRIGQLPATQQLQRNRRVFPLLVLVLPTRLPRDEVEVDGKKEEEKADAVSRIWFLPAMPPTKRGFVDGIPSVLWSLCTNCRMEGILNVTHV